jgi:transcription factor IIIB subunit 2
MQWRYEIDVVTDFLLVRRGRRSRRRKRRTSSGFCVLIMEGEECSVCGEGRLTLDPVYGVIACDVCGRVVNEMETQLASKHQMGHVMERGGTFVAAEDTGAIAAGGVSIYGDGSAANLHRNFINRQELNKVGFPWTYSASTTTNTIKENFRVSCCVMKFGGWKLVLVCLQGEIFSQMEVMKTMRRITSVLRVPTEKVRDVKFMLESVLENEWGQGRWIEILVGACIYIAIRQSQLPLTLLEVAV